MTLSLADTQVLIDQLFERLEATDKPAGVNQLTHSLRLHITKKYDAGVPLAPREQGLIDALGFIRNRRRGSAPMAFMITLIVLIIVYVAWTLSA